MKILIHGAVNGSNFGDCLFANIFFEYLKKRNHKVCFVTIPFFGISEYLKNELRDYDSNSVTLLNADCLLYMSGGYLGDTTGSVLESIKRFIRYFIIAIPFIVRRKPIYFCGIGGGPIKNKILRHIIVSILNYADFISTRDQETADYFILNGVNTPITVTTDTALTIYGMKLPEVPTEINCNLYSKKNIFFHIYGSNRSNQEIEDKILPALNRFLNENPEQFRVFVGTDNKCKNKIESLRVFQELNADKVPVDYLGTWQMCSLLSKMDTVITVKLHVGIVASLYNKGVVSFPKHKTKTKRFYKQIGNTSRCKQLSECDQQTVFEMINKFHDDPVLINRDLIESAKININPFEKVGEA